MKKIIALLLVLALSVGLVACGEAGSTGEKGTFAVIAKGETHGFWLAV